MNYVIDGYNLIGALSSISLSDPQKENKLIIQLSALIEGTPIKILLVFDGQRSPVSAETREVQTQLHVIYTDDLDTADTYLIRYMTTKRSTPYTLVTSDRAILFHAKKARINTCLSQKFIPLLTASSSPLPEKPGPRLSQGHIDYWLDQFDD